MTLWLSWLLYPSVIHAVSVPWHAVSICGMNECPAWYGFSKHWLIGKDPDAGKYWGQEEKGTTEDDMIGWHHRPNEHEFEQTRGDSKEGKPGMLQSMGWQRVGHDWATEQQSTDSKSDNRLLVQGDPVHVLHLGMQDQCTHLVLPLCPRTLLHCFCHISLLCPLVLLISCIPSSVFGSSPSRLVNLELPQGTQHLACLRVLLQGFSTGSRAEPWRPCFPQAPLMVKTAFSASHFWAMGLPFTQ